MLQPEEKRYTFEEIFNHPWMKKAKISTDNLDLNFDKLKKFSRLCHLKKYVVSSIASQLTGK